MIALTVPVKNRAPMLPEFLRCLAALEWPKHDLALLLINDGSTDESGALLRAYADAHAEEYGVTRYWEFDTPLAPGAISSRDVQSAEQRQQVFRHLAFVRNFLLDAVTILECDAQFSVDSDIFIAPDTLRVLHDLALPYVAALVVNDNHAGTEYARWARRTVNAAVYCQGGFLSDTTYPLESVIETGMSGACYLARREVVYSGARFAYHSFGEDAGYALQLRKRGIPLYVETTPGRAWHCMAPEHLDAVFAARKEAAHDTALNLAGAVA